LDAFNHQAYPFDRLIEELNPVVGPGRAPLFDVALILQNVQVGHISERVDMDGVEVEPIIEDLKISKSDLRFQFAQQGAYLGGSIEYSTDLYDQIRIKRMVAHLEGLLKAVLKEPNHPLYELEFLDEEEKTQEYEEANLFGASISKNY
jgi:tyrocidine synthetase-3